MQDNPIIVWGKGEPVVLIHGSGDTDPAFVLQMGPLYKSRIAVL